jgi:hypothetical protein
MNKYICTLSIVALMLSSCSSKGVVEDKVQAAADDEPFLDQPVSSEVQKREPIFVYKDQSPEASKRISLKLNGEPLLLTSGYVRLAGVVSGGRPIALVEVGGKGLALENGDKVSGYRVFGISKKHVQLVREEE